MFEIGSVLVWWEASAAISYNTTVKCQTTKRFNVPAQYCVVCSSSGATYNLPLPSVYDNMFGSGEIAVKY